jgi:hypothetical protein
MSEVEFYQKLIYFQRDVPSVIQLVWTIKRVFSSRDTSTYAKKKLIYMISNISLYPWKLLFQCLSMWPSMILDSSPRMICRMLLNICICITVRYKLYHPVWILGLTWNSQSIYFWRYFKGKWQKNIFMASWITMA